MANLTKDQQLDTLRKMLELQKEMNTLAAQNVSLKFEMEDTSRVDENDYSWDNKKRLDVEISQERKRVKDGWGFWKTVLIIFGIYIALYVAFTYAGLFKEDDVFAPSMGIAVAIGVPLCIYSRVSSRSRNKAIDEKYILLLKEAAEKDAEEEKRYERDVAKAKRENKERIQPQIDANTAEGKRLRKEFESISILGEEDEKHLSRVIDLMKSGRADSVKEALQMVDDDVRRQEEKRRREEQEAAEKAKKEAEEKAKRPGFVEVLVLEVKGVTGANAVYIDGVEYGCAPCKIPVSNGCHTAFLKMQVNYARAGYRLFQSPVVNFDVAPDKTTTLKFSLDGVKAIKCKITEG